MRNILRIYFFPAFVLLWIFGCDFSETGRVFNVKDYGALGDGETVDTRAINSAIEACVNSGGGTVLFPSGGIYLSGTIHLASSTTYVIEKGATICAAPAGIQAYDTPEDNPWSDYQDFGHSYFKNSLFYGDSLKDIKFIGEGSIDGSNMSRSQVPSGDGNKTFAIKQSVNLVFKDITIEKGGWFAFLLNGCNKVIFDNVKIRTVRDGIDLMSCSNVLIKNCDIRCLRYDESGTIKGGDDAIGIKSDYALGKKINSENITIENCFLSSACNAVQFGSETVGNFRNILVKDCVIEHADKAGLGITSNDGAIIENVTYKNIRMTKTANPIFILISGRGRSPENPTPGKIRNIRFENIVATDCYGYIKNRVFTSTITGLPDFPVDDVVFKDVSITYKGGGSREDSYIEPPYGDNYSPRSLGTRPASAFYIRNAKNISFNNFTVDFEAPDYRPAFVFNNVDGCSITNSDISRFQGVQADIVCKSTSGLEISPSQSFTILNQ